MADTKITGLLTPQVTTNPATDVLPIVNIADTLMAASGSTRKITVNQLLGAGGTATLASATITGDLTVKTNVLKVDTTNNRVGIGTASPALPLEIYKASGDSKMRITSGANSLTIGWDDPNGFYYTANTSLMAWQLSGSTAMTLNSTGLGVGVASPAYKLDVNGTANCNFLRVTSASGTALSLVNTTSGLTYTLYSANAASNGFDGFAIFNGTSYDLRIVNGNVGIGVTPSAWGAGGNIQGTNGFIWSSYDASVGAGYYYASGSYKYISTAAASIYSPFGGTHKWFTAAGGQPAGTNFTPTQAMTLDASGNLLVAGTSAYIRAGGRTQIVGGSVVDINTVGNNVGIAFGGASSILPCDGSSTTTDGVANFGSASKRWNTIYASTGTINTSDQNEKQDIADLGDAEKRVAGKIKSLVKKYRFKDAVASKGENARIHVGWIAQDIQNAFSSEGLDASKYGVFCSDTWEENGVQKTRLGLRYDEVLAFVVSVI